MSTTILNISEKVKQDPTGFVSITDFQFEPGDAMDPTQIILDPTLSLYCLDHGNQRAVFVQTPPDIDLTLHPFFYQAQYEHANRLIAVPYEIMHKLADELASQPKKLLLIYSVGRCGSTLLSQVFDQVDGVLSLSEPDFFTNIVLLREENGRSDPALTPILRSSLFMLQKPLPLRNPQTWAIKFRSSGIEIADLIHQVAPAAQSVFLYRDAIQRTRSEARAFNLYAKPTIKMRGELLQKWIRLIPFMANYKRKAKWGRLTRIEMSALAWLSRMDKYHTLYNQDIPIHAIRYEDLVAQPEKIISQLFTRLNISQEYVGNSLHVFARDSQSGSSLARVKVDKKAPQELSPQHIDQITKILTKHPVINTADYILPGTVK